MSWPLVKLGSLCEISRGGSPRPIQDYLTEADDGLNWIKIGDVNVGDKYIVKTAEKIKPSGLAATRQVEAGDFLLSNSMSFGRPYISKISGCIHDGWLMLRDVNKNFSQDYLYHMLSSPALVAQFKKFATGAVVKNLNKDVVQNVLVPLPPLADQKRIAAILDKAAEIKAKREQAIAKLDELAQSTFVEMFEVKNKKTMSSVKVQDICEFKYGKSLPDQNRTGGDVKVYGSNGVVGFHNHPLTSGETIIVGRKGSFGEINFCDASCYPIDTTFYIDETATKQNLTWLRFALGRLGLNKMNKSAAVPGLSREDAYRQAIFVPAQAEQIVFERRIKCIENQVKTLNSSLDGVISLITSLQHQAFTTGFNA